MGAASIFTITLLALTGGSSNGSNLNKDGEDFIISHNLLFPPKLYAQNAQMVIALWLDISLQILLCIFRT